MADQSSVVEIGRVEERETPRRKLFNKAKEMAEEVVEPPGARLRLEEKSRRTNDSSTGEKEELKSLFSTHTTVEEARCRKFVGGTRGRERQGTRDEEMDEEGKEEKGAGRMMSQLQAMEAKIRNLTKRVTFWNR